MARTHFEEPNIEQPGHVDPATNAPNYTHSWTFRLPSEPVTTEEFVPSSGEYVPTIGSEETDGLPETTATRESETSASPTESSNCEPSALLGNIDRM